ncbi:MAG: hypothetical protein KDA25_01660, partial [Phycisphaerales bacterium]|nr:hypothetical protein [Phycisphaerales bacterium]
AGKGAKMYRYDPGGNTWTAAPDTMVSGARVANEALAYDPVSGRMYATIVEVMTGQDASVRRGLAIYRPETNAWLGVTPLSDTVFGAGSEAEVLDGRVYVWRGGFGGGAVSGADSFLHVYDIGSATWSTTPSLQDSGILPGFRSGAFDIWGVTITSDAARGRLFVSGGEANANVYVFDVATQAWTVAPIAVYDGGWGDGLEYVASSQTLYQIDGRNAAGAPQGTAGLEPGTGDLDGDGVVGPADLAGLLAEWGECADPCCPADLDESGDVGPADLATLLGHWG